MTNNTPLAQRMRPKALNEIIGQAHLLSNEATANAPIYRMVSQGHLPSLILHGEAGIGKTTIATLLANAVGRPFYPLSAISAGVKQLREVLDIAQANESSHINNQDNQGGFDFGDSFLKDADETINSQNAQPVVFIDEIHRFNKSQQDALLGAVESGDITLIGATTENPSFSVNNALLSRCQVYRLEPLSEQQIEQVLLRAISQDEHLKTFNINLQAGKTIAKLAHGDARKSLNILEFAVQTTTEENGTIVINDELISHVAQTALTRYDKNGEQHYDIVSAMIKSIRGSDPDASVYWMARMLVGGEDPTFIARRLVISASEDIGLANPNALLIADTALRSVQSIGMPEARIILAQAVIYLATSAKSNSAYKAINKAMAVAKDDQSPVPFHLRNGVTGLMKEQCYGKGYVYTHDHPNHYYPQQYLPDNLVGMTFYHHADNQKEQHNKQFMEWLKSQVK